MEMEFKQLEKFRLQGLSVTTKWSSRLRYHFVLSSYVGDIPEIKYSLSVKHGVLTPYPCLRYMTPRQCLSQNIKPVLRTLSHLQKPHSAFSSLCSAEAERAAADDLPMRSTNPEFSNVPFMDPGFENGLYSLLSSEPMHSLSLDVSKLLKQCRMKLLRDRVLSMAALSVNGQTKSFQSVRRKILSFLSSFLVTVESEWLGWKLNLNFLKTAVPGELDGVFWEIGLAGMLKANDYAIMDMVLPV